jgi:hypothetical protein
MPRTSRARPAGPWTVQSVYVRKRDGPQRIQRAYLLLLGNPHEPPTSPSDDERSHDHARGHLCPRLHGAPGARANH